MKGKRIGTSILAAIMLAGTTATSALAAMPDQTAVLGEKAFSLKYVNASENETEIREAIKETMKAGKKIYVKARNVWYNNDESKLADTSVIPAVVYKTADSEVSYEAGDGEEATEGFMIKEISATDAKEITVSFTEAVSKEDQEKVSFTIKKGKTTVTKAKVEFNEEGTEAVISLASKIIKAEYAVEVKGLELEDNKRTFAGEKERAEVIAIKSGDKIAQVPVFGDYNSVKKEYPIAGYKAYVAYEVQNQYGKAYSVSQAVKAYGPYDVTESNSNGKIEIKLPEEGLFTNYFTKEMPLSLTITAGAGADLKTKLYSGDLVKNAKINEAEFGKLYKLKDGELVEIEAVAQAKEGTVYIALDLQDQYGEKINKGFLVDRNLDSGSNNEMNFEAKAIKAITKNDNFSFIDGALETTFVVNPEEGSKDQTIYAKVTGKFDPMMPINITLVAGEDVNRLEVAVNESTILDQYNIETPDLMAAGDVAEITVEAFDKAGDQLTDKALFKLLTEYKVPKLDASGNEIKEDGKTVMIDATGGAVDPEMLKPSVGTLKATFDYVTEKIKITWAFEASSNTTGYDKTITLATTTKTHKYDTVIKELKPAIKATEIALTDKKVDLMTPGATQSFSLDKNITVYDQYNREMKTEDIIDADITIKESSDAVADLGVKADDDRTWEFTGAGSAKTTYATISLRVDEDTTSDVEVAVKTIKTSAVKSLHLKVDELMYVGDSNRNGSHNADVEVYGETSNGARVALASTDYVMQSNIGLKTADNLQCIAITGQKVTLENDLQVDALGEDKKEKSFTIYAAATNLSDATNVPTANIKLSIAAPTLTEVKVVKDKTVVSSDKAQPTVGDLLNSFVVLKDQYGVTMKNAAVKNDDGDITTPFSVDQAARPSLVVVQKATVADGIERATITATPALSSSLFTGGNLENGNNYEVKMFFAGQKTVTFKVVFEK